MRLNERDVEAAYEETEGQTPKARRPECFPNGLADRLIAKTVIGLRRHLGECDGERDHQRRTARKDQERRQPAEPADQDLADRWNRELPERSPGHRNAERDPALL